MHRQKIDNKTLDAIGRRLVKSERLPSNEIDEIVANGQLFSMVASRIAADKTSRPVSAGVIRSAILFARRNAVVLAGVLVLLFLAMGVTSRLRSENLLSAIQDVQVPGAIPDSARPETPLSHYANGLLAGRAPIDTPRQVTAVKTTARRPRKQATHEPENEFYAVSFAGSADETGGRIIRVDLHRSSLFALGVNIPLENDAEIVKADLLIGSDGTTRAVRVVR